MKEEMYGSYKLKFTVKNKTYNVAGYVCIDEKDNTGISFIVIDTSSAQNQPI